jgi:cell division protein FtsX
VIVNDLFVRQLFPYSDGIGKRFGTGIEGSVAQGNNKIIGVVSSAKYRSLKEPMRPTVYSLGTCLDSDFMLNVRSRARPETVIEPIRRVVMSDVSILETETLEHAMRQTTAPERLTAAIASFFGGTATLLAGIGIYGLLAYAVAQRRREIGIRMAVGATPLAIAKEFTGQTLIMTSTGVLLGLAASLLMAPVIRSLLYDVQPQDPVTLATAVILVAVIAVGATIGPLIDAIQTPAAEVLRAEL